MLPILTHIPLLLLSTSLSLSSFGQCERVRHAHVTSLVDPIILGEENDLFVKHAPSNALETHDLLEADFETFDYHLRRQERYDVERGKWVYRDRHPKSLSQLSGFSYCKHLDGSYFDMDVPLKADTVTAVLNEAPVRSKLIADVTEEPLKWDSSQLHESLVFDDDEETSRASANDEPSKRVTATSGRMLGAGRFVHLVDSIAFGIYEETVIKSNSTAKERLMQFPDRRDDPVHRFACFMAADGSNDWNELVLGPYKLLRFIEGRNYFHPSIDYKPLDPNMVGTEARLTQLKAFKFGGMEPNFCHSDQGMKFDLSTDTIFNLMSTTTRARVADELKNSIFTPGAVRKANSTRSHPIYPHRLAYIVLVHDNIESIKGVIHSILDPYVTILIHVDGKFPGLKQEVIQFVEQLREQDPAIDNSRLRVMDLSVSGKWGYSSLVYAEIAGYFELLDMNQDWEYVVNLSGFDYPLRSNDVVYKDMVDNFNGKSIVEYWDDPQAWQRHDCSPNIDTSQSVNVFRTAKCENRLCAALLKPHGFSEAKYMETQMTRLDPMTLFKSKEVTDDILLSLKAKNIFQKTSRRASGRRINFPFGWHLKKHHQWMTLHRDFIEYLRTSPLAAYIAAYIEFAEIPDETYFAIIALNGFQIWRTNDIVSQMTEEERMSLLVNPKYIPPKKQRTPTVGWFRRNWYRFRRWKNRAGQWLRSLFRRKHQQADGLSGSASVTSILAPANQYVLALRAYTARHPLICPDRKRFLFFPEYESHPRGIHVGDERKIIKAVGLYGLAYTRKFKNDNRRSDTAQMIDAVKKVDWWRVYGRKFEQQTNYRELNLGSDAEMPKKKSYPILSHAIQLDGEYYDADINTIDTKDATPITNDDKPDSSE